jgi:hypothetical protein
VKEDENGNLRNSTIPHVNNNNLVNLKPIWCLSTLNFHLVWQCM